MTQRLRQTERISTGSRRIAKQVLRRLQFDLTQREVPLNQRVLACGDRVERLEAVLNLARPVLDYRSGIERDFQHLRTFVLAFREARRAILLEELVLEAFCAFVGDCPVDACPLEPALALVVGEHWRRRENDLTPRLVTYGTSTCEFFLSRIHEWRFERTEVEAWHEGFDRNWLDLGEAAEGPFLADEQKLRQLAGRVARVARQAGMIPEGWSEDDEEIERELDTLRAKFAELELFHSVLTEAEFSAAEPSQSDDRQALRAILRDALQREQGLARDRLRVLVSRYLPTMGHTDQYALRDLAALRP